MRDQRPGPIYDSNSTICEERIYIQPYSTLKAGTLTMHQSITILLVSLLSTISPTYAQFTAQPDGLIVPFTSGLPACASYCGPLFDVQGACTPPNIAATDDNCFCTDARLTPFDTDTGTTGVSTVCGTASCTDATDLQAVKTWYDNFCATSSSVTSVSSSGSAATATSTSTSTAAVAKAATGQSW